MIAIDGDLRFILATLANISPVLATVPPYQKP